MFITRRRRQERQRHYATLAVLLILSALAGLWLVQRFTASHLLEKERQAAQLGQAATQAVRQRIERSLEAITSLHALARRARLERLAHPGAPPTAIESHLVELTHAGRFGVLQVAIIDAAGWLAWTTVPGFDREQSPVDLSDRLHFRVHYDGMREPYVSAPLVGRASGRWSVQITRAILDETGGFLGVVVVSFDPLELGADLGALNFAPGAAATLLRLDGAVLARSGDAAQFLGRQIQDRNLTLLASRNSGTERLTSSLNGREVLASWQRIEGWPLLISFGLDYERIVAESDAFQRMLMMVLMALVAGGGAAGLLIISWSERRAERADAARAESSMREVTELLEAMPGAAYRGTVGAGGDYQRLYLGSAIVKIVGWGLRAFDEPAFYADLATYGEGFRSREEFLRHAFETSEAIAEYRLRTADDQWIWVRDHCRVLRPPGPDGRAEVVGLIIDITAERKLKAQAIATAKLATLGEMATGVAHELNQPCASITLAADVACYELDRGSAADLASARRRLDEIAQQTMRMREVIDHFQIFGRRSEGKDGGEVSIAQAVSGALKISTGTLNAEGIKVHLDIPPDLPKIRAQLVPLEQVLVNVLVNARDAMRDVTGIGRQIEIAAHHDAAAAQITLTVRDHGHGLAPEDSERLFEPFFTTKPVGEGTGLGLAIAYGTLRGFGGTIAIQNHPDGGAVVTLRLNVADAGFLSRKADEV